MCSCQSAHVNLTRSTIYFKWRQSSLWHHHNTMSRPEWPVAFGSETTNLQADKGCLKFATAMHPLGPLCIQSLTIKLAPSPTRAVWLMWKPCPCTEKKKNPRTVEHLICINPGQWQSTCLGRQWGSDWDGGGAFLDPFFLWSIFNLLCIDLCPAIYQRVIMKADVFNSVRVANSKYHFSHSWWCRRSFTHSSLKNKGFVHTFWN